MVRARRAHPTSNAFLTVEVTADDIRRGKREDYNSCPVAIASRRAFRRIGQPIYCLAFEDRLEFKEDGHMGLDLPARARTFIAKFDAGGRKTLKPFTFRLPLTALNKEAASAK